MGGVCGSFGTLEDLNPLVSAMQKEDDRILYALNPGLALVGKEGKCLGGGFFYGRIYSNEDIQMSLEGKIEDVAKSLSELVMSADGEFLIAASDSDKLCVTRDYFGKLPVYMQKEPLFSFSTYNGGFAENSDIGRLSDGTCILAKNNKVIKSYKRPKLSFSRKRKDIFESIPLINSELEAAIGRRAEYEKNPAILFSGGLDSSLLAVKALEKCDATLCTIGSEGSDDMETAMAVEDEMGAKIVKIDITNEIIEKEIPFIKSILESPSILDLEIALPFYLAAKYSNSKLIMSGQGADELFGGYFKYNEAYKKSPIEFEKMQLKDINELGEKNLERDQIAVRAGGSHLTTPYLTQSMVNIALSTDTMTKINVRHNKLVLRKIGEASGLPKSIYDRNKKALQYGSGIHTIFKKMAKEKGITKEIAKEKGYMGPLEMLIDSY